MAGNLAGGKYYFRLKLVLFNRCGSKVVNSERILADSSFPSEGSLINIDKNRCFFTKFNIVIVMLQ